MCGLPDVPLGEVIDATGKGRPKRKAPVAANRTATAAGRRSAAKNNPAPKRKIPAAKRK